MNITVDNTIKMTVTITSEKLIKQIQEEFNALFPFLRIEFFIRSKETIKKISNTLTIGKPSNIKEPATIEISPLTIVKDFESDFEDKFGMCARLYRRSGKMWQLITITDSWTMKQQDKTGNEISSFINEEHHCNV